MLFAMSQFFAIKHINVINTTRRKQRIPIHVVRVPPLTSG